MTTMTTADPPCRRPTTQGACVPHGHLAGEEPTEHVCVLDDRLVPGNVRLRRQDIVGLGAGERVGDVVKGEGGHALINKIAEEVDVYPRRYHTDQGLEGLLPGCLMFCICVFVSWGREELGR